MVKTTIGLLVGASLVMLAPEAVHARGCGGARGGGGGGMQRGGGGGGMERGGGGMQRGGESRGGESRGGGQEGMRRGGDSFGGPSRGGSPGSQQRGGEYASGETRGGGARGGTEWGAAGAAAQPSPGGSPPGGWGAYSAGHAALPTDAGYGAATRGVGAAGVGAAGVGGAGVGAAGYAGYHQTEAASGSVYAARGAATRTAFGGSTTFNQGWYAGHPGAWNPAGWTAGRAWGAATWSSVGSYCGFSAQTQPVYYDYGNNVTYQGNQVLVDNQPVATADQYFQQASTLAQSQPAPDPNAGEWLPLGVFGLVTGDQTDPHYLIQLAVNKSGAVAGNYHDVVSGTTLPVQGAVDKQTQRLAWTVGDNKTTVGETGIYNLTKDEAPALIHIGKDKTQQWTLVRLKQQQEPAQQ